MLTKESIEELHETLVADRITKLSDDRQLPLPEAFYSQLLNWMIEVRKFHELRSLTDLWAFLHFFPAISQHMEDIRCHRTTRYLAKLYLDTWLLKQNSVESSKLQLMGITSIKLAIKFNETFEYPVAFAIRATGQQYTIADILQAEVDLLISLEFKLKLTTPYCFIKTIKQMVPINDESCFNHLELLIQYCSMLPSLIGVSSGQVFFASLLYIFKVRLIHKFRAIVLALASRWPHIEQTADSIGRQFQLDNQETVNDSPMEVEAE